MSVGTNLSNNIHSVDRTGEFYFDVARGRYDDLFAISKFGRNPDVDTGSEDLWARGGTWVGPITARIHNVVSTDIADDLGGTGMETVRIYGLDADYNLIEEDVTMDGTTNVPTANAYTMIYRMTGLTAGSGGTNAGTVTATAVTDGTVTAQIEIGQGQTQLGVYQVPAGYTAYLGRYGGSTDGAGGTNVAISVFGKPFGGMFNLKHNITLRAGGSSAYTIDLEAPLVFTEKTIIKLRVTVDGDNNDVSGSFDVVLQRNNS